MEHPVNPEKQFLGFLHHPYAGKLSKPIASDSGGLSTVCSIQSTGTGSGPITEAVSIPCSAGAPYDPFERLARTSSIFSWSSEVQNRDPRRDSCDKEIVHNSPAKFRAHATENTTVKARRKCIQPRKRLLVRCSNLTSRR
jgi:hypothetical protein